MQVNLPPSSPPPQLLESNFGNSALPLELFQAIVNRYPLSHLLRLRLVCRSWRASIDALPRVYQAVSWLQNPEKILLPIEKPTHVFPHGESWLVAKTGACHLVPPGPLLGRNHPIVIDANAFLLPQEGGAMLHCDGQTKKMDGNAFHAQNGLLLSPTTLFSRSGEKLFANSEAIILQVQGNTVAAYTAAKQLILHNWESGENLFEESNVDVSFTLIDPVRVVYTKGSDLFVNRLVITNICVHEQLFSADDSYAILTHEGSTRIRTIFLSTGEERWVTPDTLWIETQTYLYEQIEALSYLKVSVQRWNDTFFFTCQVLRNGEPETNITWIQNETTHYYAVRGFVEPLICGNFLQLFTTDTLLVINPEENYQIRRPLGEVDRRLSTAPYASVSAGNELSIWNLQQLVKILN